MTYWFGTGSPVNLTLGNASTYTGTIAVPHSAGVMRYYLTLVDTAGNMFSGPVHIVTVIDNDAPVIGVDGSAVTAGPGANFVFNISAADNIGITQAQVIYWFGNGVTNTQNLDGFGLYNLTIVTPVGLFDDLHYYSSSRTQPTTRQQPLKKSSR
jgi:hypothetical protein